MHEPSQDRYPDGEPHRLDAWQYLIDLLAGAEPDDARRESVHGLSVER